MAKKKKDITIAPGDPEKMYAVFMAHPIHQRATSWTTREIAMELIRRIHQHGHAQADNKSALWRILDYPMNADECKTLSSQVVYLTLRKAFKPEVYLDPPENCY